MQSDRQRPQAPSRIAAFSDGPVGGNPAGPVGEHDYGLERGREFMRAAGLVTIALVYARGPR